jgi:2-polyprenyl-3-methyl-5-hydroxy-6-metoxy-1,4-benzoquinol methylase
MIEKEEVTWAYRMLLAREPENEAVVNHYATSVGSRAALRALFVQSAEFGAIVQNMPVARQPVVLSGPPMAVELSAPADQLTALFAKVSAQWHHLGQTEPHWSVITHQSFLQANLAGNQAAFYASGKPEVAVFDATLARVGLGGQRFDTCFELGCGVGRVTAALAGRCTRVVGIDISAHHLQLAQAHLQSQGLANVQLHHAASVGQVAPAGGYDLLYTRIVLQHNPPPVMHHMLGQLLAQLNPGGVAYFQLPTYKAGYSFSIDSYLATDNTTNMEMHYLPQQALFGLLAAQQCTLLEIREDDATGLSPNAVSNTMLVRKAV